MRNWIRSGKTQLLIYLHPLCDIEAVTAFNPDQPTFDGIMKRHLKVNWVFREKVRNK